MTASWLAPLLVALAGCLADGFFSGTETGLVSLDRLKVRGGGRTGGRREYLLGYLLERQESLLATTLVGTNLFLVGTSVIVTGMAESRWGEKSLAGVTVILTLLFFLGGELIPKAFFRRHAHEAMAVAAIPLLVTHYLFRPITMVTGLVVAAVFRLMARPRRSPYLVSREELEAILAESGEGASRASEKTMIERALLLRSTTCREVMIPLADVASVSEDVATEEVLESVRRGGPTRLPVYRERVDQIAGLINVFDILYDEKPRAEARGYMRPVDVVPDSQRIDALLVELRRKRSGMAAVVNEFGSCVGIVTVEDLVEEIVGELADEHETPTPQVTKVDADSYLVDGRVDLDDLERELSVSLGEVRVATIGGLVLSRLGKVPLVGEKVELEGVVLEVADADRYGVRQVKLTRKAEEGDGGEPGRP